MLSRQAVRGAHHAAAVHHAGPIAKAPEQVTKLPSGLTVASAEHYGPVSHFVVAFRAGSRYEAPNESGLVHHIRNMAGTDSRQYGGAKLIWSAGSAGADISSFSTADYLGVRVSVPRDNAALGLSVLGHLAADPAFKEWDLDDVLPSLKADLNYLQPTDYLFADILRAAYRNGSLSHPTYAAEHNIGKYSGEQLRKYAASRFVAGQGIIYGVNIEHDRLKEYGEVHAPVRPEAGSGPSPSPYKGGEWRRENGSNLAHVLLAGPGAAAGDAAGLAVQAVLVASLGTGAPTKYGSAGGRGFLYTHLNGAPAGVSAYEQAFEGEGIAGAYVLASPSGITEAVKKVARALKAYACDDLEAAKARAKQHILRRSAHSADSATSRSAEILAGLKEKAVLDVIHNVTAAQVDAAAKKLSSNLSIASYGNISAVPYRDEL